MAAGDIPSVTAIDAAAFGAKRKFLIESLFQSAATTRFCESWGPIVATNEAVADTLLDAALGCVSGPVFLDLIDGRDILIRHLQQRDFSVQRSFLRMGLNRRAPFGDPGRLFVVAGPEFG
jgi:hypothetical protein